MIVEDSVYSFRKSMKKGSVHIDRPSKLVPIEKVADQMLQTNLKLRNGKKKCIAKPDSESCNP